MIDDLAGTTVQLVSMALDASSLRHMAIANNIANVNSPDYGVLKVNFEEQLAAVKEDLLNRHDDGALAARLTGIKPFVEADSASTSDNNPGVKLDMEMVKLAQNVVHYQALLKGLANKMAVVRLAINEGRK